MKLKQWLYGATALAMLAACSDKDIAPGGDQNKGDITFSEGISYLGITIQLPDEQNTRAGDDNYQGNDRFDDGLPAEYNVDNAAVLLFYGPDEESSLFVGAYTLVDDEVTDKPNGDNITTSIKRTIQVKNKPEETDNYKLWALALVNFDADGDDAHFKIESSVNSDYYGDLTLTNAYVDGAKKNKKLVRIGKGTDSDPVTKFSDIRDLITDCDFREMKANNSNSVKHIFMTNAPLSNKKGTSQSPKVTGFAIQTLAELDYSKFKATQAEAQNEPAGCIFVERGLAKVTCGSFPGTVDLESTQVNLADGKSKSVKAKLTVESVSWAIDNEEQKTYIIRNTKTTDTWWGYKSAGYYNANADRWRFVGNADMNDYTYHDGQNLTHGWYRTYWCGDPNYGGDKEYNYQAYDVQGNTKNDAFTLFKNGTGNTKESEFPLYCHENTFDIAHQNYQNTTRVVFKVKYSSTVKVLKEGTTDEYEDKTNQKLFALRDQLTTFFLQEDAENLLMRAVISANQMDELMETYRTDNGTITFTKDDFSYDFIVATEDDDTRGITKGDWIFASLDFMPDFYEKHFDVDATKKAEIQEKLTQIMHSAESTYHIVPFTNNECYYAVYIKHFGDSYCKLPYTTDDDDNEVDTWKGITTEKVYGTDNETFDASQKYLGRYGMVRNNWYDLNIDKVTKIGKATVPDGNSDKSDDNSEEESFMSVRIHVLSWAKRTQHTNL